MAWLNLTQFKLRIGVTGTTYDVPLQAILTAVEAAQVLYLGYQPEEAGRTEYYSGTGTPFISLLVRPCVSVEAVYYNQNSQGTWGQGSDPFPASSLLTEGQDYAVRIEGPSNQGILVALNWNWWNQWWMVQTRLAPNLVPAYGNVKVVYTAGLDATGMGPIAEAGYLEAAAVWQSRQTGMGTQLGESLDGYSYTVSAATDVRSKNGVPRFVSPLAEVMMRPYRITPYARA